jgi:hypothetical protein
MQQRQPQKHRAILTAIQAIEIFGLRSSSSMSMMVSSATFVAKRYGVNERTIRDIWKQRTWTHATYSLAEFAGPMTKRMMGRPVGSKDMCPRKRKLVTAVSICIDSSTPSRPLKRDATMPSSEPILRIEYYDCSTESVLAQQDSAMKSRSDFLILESSDDALFFANLSLRAIEPEREEEASIDDQLHAWAHRGPQWIISAALPLHGDSPWDCAPSVC